MSRTIERTLTEQATEAAQAAAARAGVQVSPVSGVDGARDVQTLLTEIWSTGPGRPPVTAELIRALTHAGGYAAVARSGSDVVGASVGLIGHDGDRFSLHSYITGVRDGFRGGSVGFALKQDQRAWALDRGILTVTWTFDPLVRRNAYFNLVKLGAEAAGFAPNFYGAMEDGVNAGDESDRIWIEWPLDGSRAVAASRLEPHHWDPASLVADGAVRRLRVGSDGGPEVDEGRGAVELFQVPEDIVTLRAEDPALGLEWRRALRETLGAAFAEGHRATGITRDGWYVVHRS